MLKLRAATIEDCSLYFEWANDPETRANSVNSEPIPWDNHVEWFNKKFNDGQCLLFVLTDASQSLGQIRFDLKETTATLSFSIDPLHRGKGFGKKIIELSIPELKKRGVTEIKALVKKNNTSSVKIFNGLSFSKDQEDVDFFHYSMKLSNPVL